MTKPVVRRDFLIRSLGAAAACRIPPALQAVPVSAQAAEAAGESLKIRRVDPYVFRIGSRSNLVCVRIETAEGIYGWGEGTSPPTVTPVVKQIESFRDLLMERSAWEIERLWRKMYIREENTWGGNAVRRYQRHRHRSLGHCGQEAAGAGLQAAGRKSS